MRVSRSVAAFLLTPLGLFILLVGLVPTGILFAYSFYDYNFYILTPAFHATWYRLIFSDPLYRTIVWNTLAIAVPTVALSVGGGYAVAYYIVFKAGRLRALVFAVVVVSMLASYLARIYAWRTLMGNDGIVNTTLEATGVIRQPVSWLLFSRLPVILAEVNLYMPIATLILFAGLSDIASDLQEAARDLGAGRAQALRRVIMPLSGGAMLGACALCFFLSAGDYITPAMLGGVSSSQTFGTTIALAIQKDANFPLGAALSFVMILLFVVYVGVVATGLRAAGLLPRRVNRA